MYLHCEVKHAEEIKTVWLLVDGLMKDEDSSFGFSVISFCPETKQISSASPPPHPHSDLQTGLNSSPLSCAVREGEWGRRWRLTCLKHELQVGVCSAGVDISPITPILPLSCCFSENQEDNGVSRSPVRVCVHVGASPLLRNHCRII